MSTEEANDYIARFEGKTRGCYQSVRPLRRKGRALMLFRFYPLMGHDAC
jgi:hypothetical protein